MTCPYRNDDKCNRGCRGFHCRHRDETRTGTAVSSAPLTSIAYPHHCAPDDVTALVARLEALSIPAQEATPSYEDTDWRALAGVSARVIKYLRGDDWRHGA